MTAFDKKSNVIMRFFTLYISLYHFLVHGQQANEDK